MISIILKQTVLEEYPELKSVLMLMDGLISEKEMATMNYQVEQEKKNDKDVAKAFLQSKGLWEESKDE